MEPLKISGYTAFPRLLAALIAVLIAVIFVLDTITNLEIAVAVLYVAVILLAARFLSRRATLTVAAICVAATLLSYYLTPRGVPQSGLINCALSLLAIAATSYLSVAAQNSAAAERRAQARLAAATRVAALGELTGSIAHEINQPLAALVLNGNAGLRWLAADPPNLDKAKQAFRAIESEATRAGEVVNRIRSLAAGEAVPFQRLEINAVVIEGIGLAQDLLRANRVTLHSDFTPDLPRILGDRVQLVQVVLNLLTNAAEAVGTGPDGEREVIVTTRRFSADKLAFMVRDTGGGIDKEGLEQVFDAFYTTKRAGMGFGLAISRTFVEAHGGEIWAERSTPHGAVFAVSLPVVRSDPE